MIAGEVPGEGTVVLKMDPGQRLIRFVRRIAVGSGIFMIIYTVSLLVYYVVSISRLGGYSGIYRPDITATLIQFDGLEEDVRLQYSPKVSDLGPFDPAIASILALAISSVFSILFAVSDTLNDDESWIGFQLEDGTIAVNRFKWMDYAITYPLMVVTIFAISGITDVFLLAIVAATQVVVIGLGAFSEIYRKHEQKLSWAAFVASSFMFGVVFLVLFVHVAVTPGVPGFVWIIILALVLCFVFFPAVHYILCFWKPETTPLRNLKFEMIYVLIGTEAKTTLSTLVTFGSVARSGGDSALMVTTAAWFSVMGVFLCVTLYLLRHYNHIVASIPKQL